MQSPDRELEPTSPNAARTAAFFRSRYCPLVVPLSLFAVLDFFVPFTARHVAGVGSESFVGIGLTDGSGAVLSVDLTTSASEIYLSAAFSSTVMAMIAQQGVLAVWTVFGAGRWPIRFVLMIGASAGCYGLIETQLLRDFSDWSDAAQGLAVIPLRFLGMAMPLAVCRFWSGRKLFCAVDRSSCDCSTSAAPRRFAIRDLLMLTAYVAVAIALIRWTELIRGIDDQRNELAMSVLSLMTIAWAAIYVAPLAWSLLAPRYSRRAFVLGLIYAALWLVVPVGIIVKNDPLGSDLGILIGLVVGSSFTVPSSFLIWRWCGYRLI